MLASEIRTLFDYNYWANNRILTAAENVGPGQFVQPAIPSHGSLRGCLTHLAAAEQIWRVRCQTGATPSPLPVEADFPTFAPLRDLFQSEERAMRAFLAELRDEDLGGIIRYTRGDKTLSTPLWQILVHVVNHGTQTRSEAAVQLTEYGCSPGDLDFFIYLLKLGTIPVV